MNNTKTFPLRVLLTVTTWRLLTKSKGPRDNGIGDLHELLDWMTGDSAFTHQLGRFAGECGPWLLRWFPELAAVDLGRLDALLAEHGGESGVEAWVSELEADPRLKAEYVVPRIPADDHERKNPLDELVQMRGSGGGIVVVKTDGGPREG